MFLNRITESIFFNVKIGLLSLKSFKDRKSKIGQHICLASSEFPWLQSQGGKTERELTTCKRYKSVMVLLTYNDFVPYKLIHFLS